MIRWSAQAAAVAVSASWLAAGTASAANPSGDSRPVLALLSVNSHGKFPAGEVESVEGLLLSALESTRRLHVVGRGDIKTLLDLEAKRQAMGCKEEDACMIAIAGALGADYVASADLDRLGKTTVLTVKVIHVRTATALVHARETVTAGDQLVHASDAIAAQIVATLFPAAPVPAAVPVEVPAQALAAAPPAVAERPAPAGHVIGIVAAVVGGAGLVVGTGLEIAAQQKTTALRTSLQPPSVQASLNTINGLVDGAIVGWAGGGAIAATGAGLLVVF